MKKLKGACEIILTDINTGEKTVSYDENVVTNALQDLFNIQQRDYITSVDVQYQLFQDYTPMTTSGVLGGVLCFQNKIEGTAEDLKKKTELDITNPLIAHAGTNTAAVEDDLAQGTYNATESGPIENGYKYVWDFSTSQGVGEISSVCLTSAWAGKYAWKKREGGDVAYYPDGLGIVEEKLTFYKYHGYDDSVKVCGKTGDWWCWQNELTYDNSWVATSDFYFWKQPYDFSINEKLRFHPGTLSNLEDEVTKGHAIKFSLEGHKLGTRPFCDGKKIYFITKSGIGILQISETGIVDFSERNFSRPKSMAIDGTFAILNDYMFFREYNSPYDIYIVNTLDVDTPVTAVTSPFGSQSSILGIVNNGVLVGCLSGSSDAFTKGCIISLDGSKYYFRSLSCDTYYRRGYAMFLLKYPYMIRTYEDTNSYNRYMNLCKALNYLATIDNLAQPVIKTDTQTMKIIYTVTQQEE